MEMNEPYPIEVTQSINAFLDRIEQVLLNRGTPRAERMSICAEVETQINTMIERKVEAGAEIHLDLVSGIIESMDPPESYAQSVEPAAQLEPVSNLEPRASVSQPAKKKRLLAYLRSFLEPPARTSPALDRVALCGLAAICLGLLFVLIGMTGRRSEGAGVFGFLMVFAGVAASGISFWRIRHSKGLLTGQRIASIGVLMLPFLIVNAILCLIIGSPFGRFLGGATMVVALVYANYRIVQYALLWLASYSAKVSDAESFESEPNTESGMRSNVIVEGGV